MGLPSKFELKEKLLEFTLLRQLVNERWFRWAFSILLLAVIGLGLSLPKVWRTSPPGFLPVVKVSGLDLVQAWSLRRTAVKSTEAGRFDDANFAWQAALANNRANPELVRGALGSILKDPHPRKYAGQAIHESFWLLRLTETNLVDLELATRVFERFHYFDPIVSLVEPRRAQANATLTALYLKSLFDLGRIEAFNVRWKELKDKVQDDSSIRLYRAAYDIGWGPPESIGQAREEFAVAVEDPKRRTLAYELKLALSAHQLDATAYGQALRKLEEWREDTLAYHIGYWRLLALAERKAEALESMRSYPNPPTSPAELVELVDLYARLGMREEGLQLLQRYHTEFGHTAIFWVTYANELIEAKRWDEVRNLGAKIRSQDGVRDQLSGFSYFLEGRADQASGRDASAVDAFKKAAEREFPYPSIGQKVGAQLLGLGHPELARQVLSGLEKALTNDKAYWLQVFSVADRLKDVDLLVKGASRAYELSPNDPVVMNNYAAALIITRREPDQAIKLTMELFSKSPDSLYAIVNHSAALLQNGRPSQAEALLSRVRTNGLNRVQLNLLNLDLFETYFSLRQFDLARSMSDRIEPELLYPTQRKWLDETRQQLPAKANGG